MTGVMGHCGGDDDESPDEAACSLAAAVVLWVGSKDENLARMVRDLGGHVMRMASREAARLRLATLSDEQAIKLVGSLEESTHRMLAAAGITIHTPTSGETNGRR